jgi:hypothetical protein
MGLDFGRHYWGRQESEDGSGLGRIVYPERENLWSKEERQTANCDERANCPYQ